MKELVQCADLLRITEALVRLGTSAREVADTLKALGIKGHRKHPQRCPLARYLKSITGWSDISVSITSWRLTEQTQGTLPQSCRDFVNGFDLRAYPELLDESVEEG